MRKHASRPAVQTTPRVKSQRLSPPVAVQAVAGPQPQPSSSAMEERKPSCPAEAEKGKTPQEPPVVPPAPPSDTPGMPVCDAERCAMDNIEAFVQRTEPQNEEQKMKFLQSIRTICSRAAQRNAAQELRIFCRRNNLVENIMVLLAEEPHKKLSSELRLQAMATITALSKVEGLLEEKIPLFHVCFQSILLLPSEQDLDVSLYSKTLRALDEMLDTLVFVHPTAGIGEELKNAFQVLLPFTSTQNSAACQRAVGRIWKLCHSLAYYCQERRHHSSGRFRPICCDKFRLPVLGQLVGSLILCCACQEDKTHRCALSALHHLYKFILWRSRWEVQPEEQGKQEQWEDEHELSLTWTTNTSEILLRFAKHFHSWETTDFILVMLQGMKDCSNCNAQAASNLMGVLMADFKPTPNDVQRIVTAIHRSRKLITEEEALKHIHDVFPRLAAANPRAVTLSLLRCSPTCDKDARELWELALSSEDAIPKMMQELLRLLEIAPLGLETESSTLSLAAVAALYKLLQNLEYGPQVRQFFPELFVALVLQLVSCEELCSLEAIAITEEPFGPASPTSAARMVVETLRLLLLCSDMEDLAFFMETYNLWARLPGAAQWQNGLYNFAKVLMRGCQSQCRPIFIHLQKLLRYHQLQWREVPAMALYFEMWILIGFRDDDYHAEMIFRKHVSSKQLRSRELALLGLRYLYDERMQLLLPEVMLWLQDVRADVKLQAMYILHCILTERPASVRGVLSQLAVLLLSYFNEETAEMRWHSMELFALLLEAPGRKQLLPEAERSLLPLFIHMNEDIPNVAQAAQIALIRAAKLLGWQQLQRLASKAEVWMIADCLLQEREGDAELYVKQTMLHLNSPQAALREVAVRFLGMLAQKLKNKNEEMVLDIRKALQGAKGDRDLAVKSLVQQTLLILCQKTDVPPTRPRGRASLQWLQRKQKE
ncbi:maestro heat-like repeat family member 5 isoform X2 [Lagopus muta]|nr:maestro heat-like repeat family member 5 isoform X2 [Lagopus muta]XP_048786054.1 maestro heat-like repeat family member 5 isoform X2 [Lagopus muta]XP_048786055.1 maestro heat-like repeat family member 5 isoform X2 [Lagopus muta]XP_048786056.1 maestro heat-like repeat family member 5 isoform X2 [Lagopus muta]XP_048786057.1 maestro heat-like repeat family member 5 isoform X2 [Lagopus muta]XP_048786058.1 maestro heat-like repeat family member 5 isoform X2 [Lagopus muta]XP_048786059.1 maestro 